MRKKRIKKSRNILTESWKYLKDSKNYLYLVGFLFLFSFALAFFIYPPDFLLELINKIVEELIQKTSGLNLFQLIVFIFFNNLKVSFVGLFLGILLGVIPLVLTVFNGYVSGFVSSLVIKDSGIIELWRLFPHGIFELPAVFISLGLGIKLGMCFFSKNPDKEFLQRIKLSFKVFISIVLPLLIIAAIIEGVLIKRIG